MFGQYGLVSLWIGVAAVAAILYRPKDDQSLALFSLWTNVFFVWPALRAASLGAFSETIVFALTLVASTFHHGCVNSTSTRHVLAPSTYIVLYLSSVAIIVGIAYFATTTTTVGPRRTRKFAGIVVSAVLIVLSILVLLIPLSEIGANRLDGCAYPYDDDDYEGVTAPRLVDIWATVDFVTAFSALVVVIVYFFQTNRRVELGVFWLFAVIILLCTLLDRAHLLSENVFFGAVAALALVFIVGRFSVWCCVLDEQETRRQWARYRLMDVLAGLLVGASAILVFVEFNANSVHGWWHILAATALYLMVESNYGTVDARRMSLV